MRYAIATALAVTMTMAGIDAASADADQPKVYRQNGAVNIKVIVLDRDGNGSGAIVDQTGRYNAAAIVSRSGGGYGAIYQRGTTNRAFGARRGSGATTDIRQRQIDLPQVYKPRWAGGWRRR